MKPEKSARLKENREKVQAVVSKYINPEAERNTGQLKFLTGLLTGNLAVSIGVKLRKDNRFLDYLHSRILKNNQETLGFFDVQENLDAFMKDVYPDLEEIYQGFTPEGPAPSYLLLKKAQSVMEAECLRYLEMSGTTFESEDPDPMEEQAKKEAYVEWLFSIALYEIFLIEYGAGIPEEQTGGDPADEQNMDQICSEIIECRDREKKKQQAKALWEHVDRGWRELQNQYLSLFYINCFIWHEINLFGMLRLIAMIEFVKVETSLGTGGLERRNKDKTAEAEADTWRKLLEKYGKYNLFTMTEINPNLVTLARKFRSVYQKYEITPRVRREEKLKDFKAKYYDDMYAVHAYIHMIRNRQEMKGSPGMTQRKAEKDFREICVPFAFPVLEAVDEFLALKEKAQK